MNRPFLLLGVALFAGLQAELSCRRARPLSLRERFSRESDVRVLEDLAFRLGSSPDPGEREDALWAVHDHRGRVAVMAVRGLVKARDPRSIPHLLDRIQDPSVPEELGSACLDALFAFDPDLWRPQLEAIVPALPPGKFREAARSVLESLPPRVP